MSTYLLDRSGDARLKIDGEIFAESSGERADGREANRYHDATIYRLSSGERWAVAITYHTRWQGEGDSATARIVDSPRDVARVLRDYDPTAPVRGFPPGPAYAERQAALMANMRSRWAEQVRELLADEVFAEGDGSEDDELAGLRQSRDLRRYRLLLDDVLLSVEFSPGEAKLIADACNGMEMDDLVGDTIGSGWRFWPANVIDAIRLNHLDEKWEVDGPVLITKIRDLSPVQLCAVADAVERFWADKKLNVATADELLSRLGMIHE